MANITLIVLDNVYTCMRKYPKIKQNEVAIKAFVKKLNDLELFKLVEEARKQIEQGECFSESELLKELGIDENDL